MCKFYIQCKNTCLCQMNNTFKPMKSDHFQEQQQCRLTDFYLSLLRDASSSWSRTDVDWNPAQLEDWCCLDWTVITAGASSLMRWLIGWVLPSFSAILSFWSFTCPFVVSFLFLMPSPCVPCLFLLLNPFYRQLLLCINKQYDQWIQFYCDWWNAFSSLTILFSPNMLLMLQDSSDRSVTMEIKLLCYLCETSFSNVTIKYQYSM